LERALAELAALPRGRCLHLVLPHEPLPLLALLPDRGVEHEVLDVAPGEVHVLCWHAADSAGAALAARALAALGAGA
jgi:hypothetical protein